MNAEGTALVRRELTFADLRRANVTRLPLFRNAHGAPAHLKADGSDWDRAAWLEALVGEVGEYANFSKKYRRGDISFWEFRSHAANELADIQTYLDLLAFNLGFDLAYITQVKFCDVSGRVGCDVRLSSVLGSHRRMVRDSAYHHVPLTTHPLALDLF